jgi:hypothetical protein
MRTLAEEQELGPDTTPKLCPEDYNKFLRCVGTYCALLHTFFGKKCPYFKHCYQLWEPMDSDFVYERRLFFTPLYCRQLVWAIIEEGRAYFSSRMSPNDFMNVDPYNIVYPRRSLVDLIGYVRHQTPIICSLFPHAWETSSARQVGALNPLSAFGGLHPPVATIVAGSGAGAPTVVSGLSGGTGARTNVAPGARMPVKIRPTNIHPVIKSVLEPHITLCKGVALGPILDHIGLTVDDLPKLPGEGSLCYNYVLGRCVHPSCQNKEGHLNVADIPNEFATALIEKIRPAINHFRTNGPPAARFVNRCRRRK